EGVGCRPTLGNFSSGSAYVAVEQCLIGRVGRSACRRSPVADLDAAGSAKLWSAAFHLSILSAKRARELMVFVPETVYHCITSAPEREAGGGTLSCGEPLGR